MDKPSLTAKTIFDHARELATPEERHAYLNQVCKNNAELRQRIEALLHAYEEADKMPLPSTGTPEGRLRPSEALERLVQLYEATDKKDDAEKWRKELAKARKKAGKETHP